jgi:hypothetical protein
VGIHDSSLVVEAGGVGGVRSDKISPYERYSDIIMAGGGGEGDAGGLVLG